MTNINETYITEYIRSLIPANLELKELERYAEENHVPIIEPEVAQFLRVLLKTNKPKKILEIGTAIGYSAIVMAKNTLDQTKITSIERRSDMVELAEANIIDHGFQSRIQILEGDAMEILVELEEEYDFIFLDAAKGHYQEFFEESIRLLSKNGIILCDNVLFRGMVATDDLVIRRKITIVKRLRKFLENISNISGYATSIIPIGDGLALIYREE